MIVITSCEKNQAPTCQIIKPMDGSTIALGTVLAISISASDADGTVSEVRIFLDEIGLAELDFPYNYELNTETYSLGEYTLKVTARDNEGLESSDEVKFIIDAAFSSITTSIASNVTHNSARIGGEVTDDGGYPLQETGVYWGYSPDPVNTGMRISLGSQLGSYTGTLTDLKPMNTIYVIAFAFTSAGESYGEEISYELVAPVVGSITDARDQQVYGTVTIGEQVWMSENLKATVYNDGTVIPHFDDPAEWAANSGPAYSWYNNDPTESEWGAFYTWYTVDTKKLCPSGWHVPAESEWQELEVYLGMDAELATTDGYRGTNEGGMLKTTTHWEDPNTGASDEIGFSVKPVGRKGMDGLFLYRNQVCYFWASDFGPGNEPLRRLFGYDDGGISRSTV